MLRICLFSEGVDHPLKSALEDLSPGSNFLLLHAPYISMSSSSLFFSFLVLDHSRSDGKAKGPKIRHLAPPRPLTPSLPLLRWEAHRDPHSTGRFALGAAFPLWMEAEGQSLPGSSHHNSVSHCRYSR